MGANSGINWEKWRIISRLTTWFLFYKPCGGLFIRLAGKGHSFKFEK